MCCVGLANSIHHDIQMVADTPSDHDDGKVPMLELAFHMEEVEEETIIAGKELQIKYRKICYSFFMKPIASPPLCQVYYTECDCG